MSSIGAYVHIPFCIQRCHYCDFATYAKDQISANDEYVDQVCKEIHLRRFVFEEKSLQTIYFGGGTPSLLTPEQIDRIISQYKSSGFVFDSDIEVTMEVNPATLTPSNCLGFKEAGVNRMSIGCQSFNDDFLKACNREHSAQDTRNTINLVKKHFDNFSLDLLFSLPNQSLENLESDLAELTSFAPPHISAYCLTLPEKHPMNEGRCPENEQVEMFGRVLEVFQKRGLQRYEISNFSKPGFESRHNNLYWADANYWGVGLSAHSYKKSPDWGYRFWNPSSYQAYMKEISSLAESKTIENSFANNFYEKLKLHESLTDYCHTRLRMTEGLNMQSLRQKFGSWAPLVVEKKLSDLISWELMETMGESRRLTPQGFLLSNQVFQSLLFSASDIDKA